jgi:hypothetical protein
MNAVRSDLAQRIFCKLFIFAYDRISAIDGCLV